MILYALVSWIASWFRKPAPLAAPQTLLYEWEDTLYCGHCDAVTTHRFVEWSPGFVITDECKWCGIEVVQDIETRFE